MLGSRRFVLVFVEGERKLVFSQLSEMLMLAVVVLEVGYVGE